MRRPLSTKARLQLSDLDLVLFREHFNYDPATGKMTWAVNRPGRIHVGKEVGAIDTHGHRRVRLRGRTYGVHRIAWMLVYEEDPGGDIDHINGDPADNRISNLRAASHEENCRNTKLRKSNTSGLKGVSAHGARWKAQICSGRRKIHIGVFGTKAEAHAAYSGAAKALHGKFARLK